VEMTEIDLPYIKEMEVISRKKETSLQNSASEFPFAIVISSLKGLLVDFHIQRILDIEKLIGTHSYMRDSQGKANFRRLGKQALILLKQGSDINEIKDIITTNMEKLVTEKKIPKYKVHVFEGNPLDTYSTIKVKVKNPDPKADKTYYQDFGEVDKVIRSERIRSRRLQIAKQLPPCIPRILQIKNEKEEKTLLLLPPSSRKK